MSFDIPLLIIVLFLLLTLVATFCSISRLATFREHAVGTKQLSIATLVAVLLSSHYGGGGLMLSIQALGGFFWISWRIFGAVAPFLVLSWLATHMPKCMYHISMAETVGRLYGKYPRIITAVFGICYSIAVAAMQIRVMSEAVRICIPTIHPLFITLMATGTLVSYVILGGIRVITITNVWQSIAFTSCIAILAWLMFKKTGQSTGEIFSFLQMKEKFALSNLFPSDRKLVVTLRYLSTLVNCIEPCYVHVTYMSSSPRQAKKVYLYTAIFSFFIIIAILLVGLFIFVWTPVDLPEAEVWHYIMTHISSWIKGMICVCLFCLAMSTADSRLHMCTIMISYDLLQSLGPIKKVTYVYQRRLANIAMLCTALLATVLALYADFSIVRRVVVWYTRWYVPVVVAPFILAILGFPVASRTALVGMATGALAVFTWTKWIAPITKTDSSAFPCMVVNGLAVIAAHYLWPRAKNNKCNRSVP